MTAQTVMRMKSRNFTKIFLITIVSAALLCLAQNMALSQNVNITETMQSMDIVVGGKSITIERNQDKDNRLTNSFAKTSRPCPPFCIHPMIAAPGVRTVGELEILEFLKNKVEPGTGLLIDARIAEFYTKGTIPGSVNIPFTLFSAQDNPYVDKIRQVLGGIKQDDGNWNFSNALDLAIFCNGPWCDQSPQAIKNLVSAGYPPEKLFYYRGGMQNWQALGLTVLEPQS